MREALLKILRYLMQRPVLLGAVLGLPFVGMGLATTIWANVHTHDRATLGVDKFRQHLRPWGRRP